MFVLYLINYGGEGVAMFTQCLLRPQFKPEKKVRLGLTTLHNIKSSIPIYKYLKDLYKVKENLFHSFKYVKFRIINMHNLVWVILVETT